jgi:hypothetical protein
MKTRQAHRLVRLLVAGATLLTWLGSAHAQYSYAQRQMVQLQSLTGFCVTRNSVPSGDLFNLQTCANGNTAQWFYVFGETEDWLKRPAYLQGYVRIVPAFNYISRYRRETLGSDLARNTVIVDAGQFQNAMTPVNDSPDYKYLWQVKAVNSNYSLVSISQAQTPACLTFSSFIPQPGALVVVKPGACDTSKDVWYFKPVIATLPI